MYRATKRFAVRRGELSVMINGIGCVVTQGSWVAEGAEIPDLTAEELEWYGGVVVAVGAASEEADEPV